MTPSWRLAFVPAVLFVCAGVRVADAQTVVLRHAAPATSVEVVFGTVTGKAAVQQNGDAEIELPQFPGAAEEISVAISIDTCGTTVRALLVGRAEETPPPAPGCQRRQVTGFWVMRPDTSLMIDLAPSSPTVRIRQGGIPAVWYLDGPIPTGRTSPRGLIAWGGGGLGRMPDTLFRLCGNAFTCTRENTKLNFQFGAAYWLTRWLGVEGSFIKPLAVEAEGFDDAYEFVSEIAPRAVAVSALGGLNVGPARFYGRIGAAYHRAAVRTLQITYARTIDVGDTVETFPGGEQSFTFATVGWGPIWGGGVEGWVSEKTALFADVSFIRIEGENANDDSAVRTIDERPVVFSAGVKIHFGFRR